jgi:hypothetical protein
MLPVLMAATDRAVHHAPGRPEQEWRGLRVAALGEVPGVLASATAAAAGGPLSRT